MPLQLQPNLAEPGQRYFRDFTPGEQAATPNVGVAQKCTLCYDRLTDDQTPACAQACPTTSIKFGRASGAPCPAKAQGLSCRSVGASSE